MYVYHFFLAFFLNFIISIFGAITLIYQGFSFAFTCADKNINAFKLSEKDIDKIYEEIFDD